MLNPVYCRQLEDKSGFGVFQRKSGWSIGLWKKVLDEKWEVCLGLGSTAEEAWKDYQSR